MNSISKNLVNFLTIDPEYEGQRLDNHLSKILKGVPKSHIQRIIRSGQVRVNQKRAKAETRLCAGDVLRIPPIRIASKTVSGSLKGAKIPHLPTVFEDEVLLVINKPSGVAVHGGSGVSWGVIEVLRHLRPDAPYLELVHRLDKDTSGLLMIAKKRSALVKLHAQLRQNHPEKIYLALCFPAWPENVTQIKKPLLKYTGAQGEKMVRVDENGQYADTRFAIERHFQAASLLRVTLKTGRTHQIRVHMQSQGCPIALDERYGNYELNRKLQKMGLKNMFLHAHQLVLHHPVSDEKLVLHAPLPTHLTHFLEQLSNETLPSLDF